MKEKERKMKEKAKKKEGAGFKKKKEKKKRIKSRSNLACLYNETRSDSNGVSSPRVERWTVINRLRSFHLQP